MAAPTAFISHASEDKEKYAEPLAKGLRAKGINAWLDKWELVPGDHLVDKVFEQGLGNASTVVFLMSANSLQKPWVKAELENAVVRHISGELRLIPLLLEPCDVPQSVRAILWIDLAREGSVEAVAERVAKTIYGHSDKPPLGRQPSYVDSSNLHIAGLDKVDELVMGMVFEAALSNDRRFVQGPDLKPLADAKGLDWNALKESTQLLCEEGYLIQKDRTIGGRHIIVEMPAATMLSIAESLGMPVEGLQQSIAGLIINEGVTDLAVMRERVNCPAALLDALLDAFQDRGFIRVARYIGGGATIHSPSVAFRRWLRTLRGSPV